MPRKAKDGGSVQVKSLADKALEVSRRTLREAVSVVPCRVCGRDTSYTATKECDACHAIHVGLADYLKRGGPVAKMFVREQLAKAEQRQKQLTELQQRVAYELNWTMPDVQSVSLQSLRDILNDGKHKKLCDEVTRAIQSGEYILR